MKKPFFGVVASIIPASMADLRSAVSRVHGATSIEVRLDEPSMRTPEALAELARFYAEINKPVILTLRSIGQGGHKLITTEGHWDFWRTLPNSLKLLICYERNQLYVDWDLELLAYCKRIANPQLFPWCKVIASWHDFNSTPQDLQYVLASLEESPAQACLKLVSKAQNPGAVARIKALFENRIDSRPLIAFAMGEYGKQSRCDCLGLGSPATFGCVPGSSQTAPGQLSVDELLADPSVQRVLQSHGF